MTRLFLALLPLVLGALQDPAADALTLRFDWPHEGHVQVRESSLKNGATAEIAYTLRWRPDESGESFVISYEDYRFLSINGQAASTPAMKAIVERIAPLMKAIPRMRISSAGQLVEFLGLDEVFEAVLDELPEDQRNAELEQTMRSPAARQLAAAAATERWNVWVAGLIGMETFVDDEWEADIETASNLPGQTLLAVQGFRCHERFADAGADCVRLEMGTTFDPDSLKANTLAVAASLGQPVPPAESLRLTRVDRVEGVWEIETLRPHRVSTSTLVTSAGEERREEHTYEFDWGDR
jgi:hypothetical protein